METIRKGSVLTEKARKFQCRECGSLILAKRKEGRFNADWRDGDFFLFACPECKYDNAIAVGVWDNGTISTIINP